MGLSWGHPGAILAYPGPSWAILGSPGVSPITKNGPCPGSSWAPRRRGHRTESVSRHRWRVLAQSHRRSQARNRRPRGGDRGVLGPGASRGKILAPCGNWHPATHGEWVRPAPAGASGRRVTGYLGGVTGSGLACHYLGQRAGGPACGERRASRRQAGWQPVAGHLVGVTGPGDLGRGSAEPQYETPNGG